MGCELAIRAHPAGEPIRDRAHLDLLRRFRATIGPGWTWRTEVPIAPARDRRAWDAVISSSGVRVGIEAETRLRDLQAVERRVSLKRRDSGLGFAVLVVSDTRNNRRVVRDYADLLAGAFPTAAVDAVLALRARRAPAADALILV